MAKSKSVTMTAGKIKSSYDLKGKTTLNIVDNYTTGVNADSYITQFVKSIDASGNNLILNCEDEGGKYKITLKNCTTLATINVSLNNDSYSYTGDTLNTFLYDLKNDITKYNAKKLTVTGSFLDDTIDFSDESLYVPTAANLKKNKGLTINAGDGADTITGTKYNDTITGGAGVNTVDIDVTKNFGNDTYKLTKGEKLNIVTNGDVTYKKDSKGNVVITAESSGQSKYGIMKISNLTYTGWTSTYYSEKGQTYVAFAGCYIADSTGFPDSYSESDVRSFWLNGDVRTQLETQANHYFEVQLDNNNKIVGINLLGSYSAGQSAEETAFLNGFDFSKIGTVYGNTQDDPTTESETMGTLTIVGLANKDITQGVTINGQPIVFDFDKEDISKNKITGTAQNDEIDIKDLDGLTKTVGKSKNKHQELKTSEDAGITINAGTGDDTITGSKYSDTITAGTGENTIKILNTAFGNDTINLTKGEKLTLDMSAYDDINSAEDLKEKVKVSGKNLVITTDNGTITLKNFAKSNVVGANGEVKVLLKKATDTEPAVYADLNIDEVLSYTSDNFSINAKKKTATFTGSRFGETISVTNELDNYTKTVNTGNGVNTVNINSSGKTTINGGSGVDIVNITNSGTVTAKLGDGNNTATINGTGINTIISGKNNDEINIKENSAITTIKAGKGENTINIDNSESFGTVILTEEKINATNIINFKNDIDSSYTITKSGADLIISKDSSKLTIQNYYSSSTKKTTYSTKKFQINGVDIESNTFIAKGTFVIGGSGTITGTENADYILANDYDTSLKASNDTITAGKGDDTINAGQGANVIKFNAGDGQDTILNGGGTDTLVFAAGTIINAEFKDGSDSLFVKYGKTKGSLNDSIEIRNFKNGDYSVKYIKVGNETTLINDFLTEKYGTDDNDSFVSTANNETYHLFKGNDTVTFSGKFGSDTIEAEAEYDKDGNVTNTTTIVLKNHSLVQNNMDINYDYDWTDGSISNDLLITAENNDDYYDENGEWIGSSVVVKDFFNDTTPNIKIKDKYHTYNVELKNGENDIDWSKDKNNHVVFLQGDGESKNKVISNSRYNVINTNGGASLEYTYKGGIDQINSTSEGSDDVYNINSFTKSTSLKINDFGGEDTISINTNSSNIRLLYDVCVSDEGDVSANIGGEILLFHKDSLNVQTLNGLFGDVPWSGGVIRVTQDGTIDNFITNDYQSGLDLDMWKSRVTQNVSNWLKNNQYNSSYEVFYSGNKTDIKNLLKQYNVTYESTIPKPEPVEELTINGEKLVQGTDGVDTLNITSTGTNRVFAGGGNDVITTGSGINYVYAGAGNDTITSGSGNDYIFGGGGSNTIYLGKGSGNDITLDENDNTFVFKDITNLNQLTFTCGAQDSLGIVADLKISGYGNSTDSLTIKNFFNLEGYDYSKIKLQAVVNGEAGVNGEAVSLYDLINNSDLKTSYFTGTYKASRKAITTSPAQKAPQIDSVIMVIPPDFRLIMSY